MSLPDGGVCLGNPVLHWLFHRQDTFKPAPARLSQIQVCSCAAVLGAQPPSSAARGGEPGDKTEQGPPAPRSAWRLGDFPPPRVAQGSWVFPPKWHGVVAVPERGAPAEGVMERAQAPGGSCATGLGTATGVPQWHREPGCFGRGGCHPPAPQMGPFPSPSAAIRAPCLASVPTPGTGRALPGAVLARSLPWARRLGHGFALPPPLPRVSRAPSPLPVSQGGWEKTSTSRDAASAAASPQTPTASSPAPCVPSSRAAADSGPPLLPTVPAAHAGLAGHRQRLPWAALEKATSRRTWHRVRILPEFEPYSSHALPPLSPRAGPDAGGWGGGAPGR